MKFIFTMLPIWLLLCAACAVNSLEQEFLCPICDARWPQRIETSGRARGLRLDLRQIGDVMDPPSLPQCPKCRFPLFSEQVGAQADDPEKATAFRQLRTFVNGADFQLLTAKYPSYFALAQVQQFLKAPERVIALSYLRASWQVENREPLCRRLLEMALQHYAAARAEAGRDYRLRSDLALLCGEIERRLGKWAEAESRFRALQASGILDDTPQANIPALQFKLLAQHDSAPHLLDDVDVAQSGDPKAAALPEEKPMLHLGNTISPGDGLRFSVPAKPSVDLPLPVGPPPPASSPTLLPGEPLKPLSKK